MANGPTHQLIGGAVGLAISCTDTCQPKSLNPLIAMSVGGIFGRLPDILEPSLNNPHHRQFFHSVTLLAGLVYGVKRAYEWQPKSSVESFLRGAAIVAGGAYLSHLAVDALTKRSLPLVGKV